MSDRRVQHGVGWLPATNRPRASSPRPREPTVAPSTLSRSTVRCAANDPTRRPARRGLQLEGTGSATQGLLCSVFAVPEKSNDEDDMRSEGLRQASHHGAGGGHRWGGALQPVRSAVGYRRISDGGRALRVRGQPRVTKGSRLRPSSPAGRRADVQLANQGRSWFRRGSQRLAEDRTGDSASTMAVSREGRDTQRAFPIRSRRPSGGWGVLAAGSRGLRYPGERP